MECAVVSEVAPSILPLTYMLILYPYTFPPYIHCFSFIPTDHEIAHQWSGNPHSWDSIYQHQRKPQRLLVKLLTNKFNTKNWLPHQGGRPHLPEVPHFHVSRPLVSLVRLDFMGRVSAVEKKVCSKSVRNVRTSSTVLAQWKEPE